MKVSVITVVYNDVLGIAKTVESVLSQRDIAVQYIVMDGGSTDGTVDVLNDFVAAGVELEIRQDKGMYDALNYAYKKCLGEYVAILNSGDSYVLDNSLASAVSRLESNDATFLYSDVFFGRQVESARRLASEMRSNVMLGLGYYHTSIVCSRLLYEQVGPFSMQYKIAADVDWLLKAYKSPCFKPIKSDPLVFMNDMGVSATLKWSSIGEYCQVLRSAGFSKIYVVITLFLQLLAARRGL